MTKQILKLFSATLILAVLGQPGGSSAGAAETNAMPADKIKELFGDAVIAKGKGWELKRSDLDTALISVKAMAAGRGQTIPPERMNAFERQVLDDLIALQLLLGKATEEDKAKGKEEFAKAFQKFKDDGKLTDAEFEEKLNPQLRVQGLTREQWEKKRVDQATVGFVLERELKISVSDADIKKFYDENPAKFEEPEMVRASHILLSTRDQTTGVEETSEKKAAKRKLAEDLLKRARAGEDFAKLAKEYSEDPGSKDKGGEYKFPRGQMVPEFESAAFSLGTNQISEIVTTQFGYHIIKLSEKLPARKVELAKISDDLKQGLKQQEIQKQMPDFIAKLKKEANVEILDEKLKAVDTGLGAPVTPEKPVEKKK
jgi:parvulin-like peptidyl-prolyl isomerase